MKCLLRFPAQKKSVSENHPYYYKWKHPGYRGGILGFRSFSKTWPCPFLPTPHNQREKSPLNQWSQCRENSLNVCALDIKWLQTSIDFPKWLYINEHLFWQVVQYAPCCPTNTQCGMKSESRRFLWAGMYNCNVFTECVPGSSIKLLCN